MSSITFGESVAAKEIVVDDNLASFSALEETEVIVWIGAENVIPTEARCVGTISVGERDSQPDLVTIALKEIELHINVKCVAVARKRFLVVTNDAWVSDGIALLSPGPSPLAVKAPRNIDGIGETHVDAWSLDICHVALVKSWRVWECADRFWGEGGVHLWRN